MARSKRLNITLVTALWRRHDISSACLAWHKDLSKKLSKEGVSLSLLAVASNARDRKLALDAGWDCIDAPNEPLGRKWNCVMGGVLNARGRVDGVMVIGSDDFVDIGFVRSSFRIFREGAEVVVAKTAVMVDGASGKMCQFIGDITIGGGRLVSSSLMECCSWEPWEPKLSSGLDGSFQRTLRIIEKTRGRRIRRDFNRTVGLMTIKSPTNLWSYKYIASGTDNKEPDYKSVERRFGSAIARVFRGKDSIDQSPVGPIEIVGRIRGRRRFYSPGDEGDFLIEYNDEATLLSLINRGALRLARR